MLCPGKPGERWARALGTRRRERACRLGNQSKPDPPTQSVRRRGGNAGSCSDHFNCGSAGGARARDTARSRRSARPARGGGGAGCGDALGTGARAPGCSPGTAARQGLLGRSGPASARGSRGEAHAPPSLAQGFAEAAGPTPLFWDGRRRFRASCVTSVCTAALTSVGVSSRTAIGREPPRSSPHPHPQSRRPKPRRSRKGFRRKDALGPPCCLSGAAPDVCGLWVG
ncbi:uncharacterized protein LOC132028833 [Mustela nigripes]|uniref:uncharacterized protein LOC132028833 n=1 Tax=Mustela nigripes TaxID=77151 RepID=UPI002815146E|nr:uncharacterized protein LOC132028833 [Mustela nigripes]